MNRGSQLRKIAIQLGTTDVSNLTVQAGILDQLKNYIADLSTGYFFKDRYQFIQSNKDLRLYIRELISTVKELDQAIEENNPQQYRHKVEVLKGQIGQIQGVIGTTDKQVQSIQSGVSAQLAERVKSLSPEDKAALTEEKKAVESVRETTKPNIISKEKEFIEPLMNGTKNWSDFYGKIFSQAFAPVCGQPTEIHVSAGALGALKSFISSLFSGIELKSDVAIAAELRPAIYSGIVQAIWKSNTYRDGPGGVVRIVLDLSKISNKPSSVEADVIVKWSLSNHRFEFAKATKKIVPLGTSVPEKPAPAPSELSIPDITPPDQPDGGTPSDYFREKEQRRNDSERYSSRRSELIALAEKPNREFYIKLNEMCERLSLNPSDVLAIMTHESGLDSAAENKNGHASGLNQIMPANFKGLGWNGSPEQFRKLNPTSQLPYVEKFFSNQINFAGRPLKNATQLYIANLYPVALKNPEVIAGNPRAVIIDRAKDKPSYDGNAAMDLDHDGKITLGDIQTLTAKLKQNPTYQKAFNDFKVALNDQSGDPEQPKQQVALNTSPAAKMVSQFLGIDIPQGHDIGESILKNFVDAIPKAAAKNQYLIEILGQDVVNSAEFANLVRIALRSEININATIHSDGKRYEVQFLSEDPRSVEKLCVDINRDLVRAARISPVRFAIQNKTAGCEPVNLNTALRHRRMFRTAVAQNERIK